MRIGRTVTMAAALSLSTLGSSVVATEDWPDNMTPAEVSARTKVHDGYVLPVAPLSVAPVEQSRQLTLPRSTLDYVAGYSPTLKQWIRLPDGRLSKGLTQVGVRATLRAVQAGGENWQVVSVPPGLNRLDLAIKGRVNQKGRTEKVSLAFAIADLAAPASACRLRPVRGPA